MNQDLRRRLNLITKNMDIAAHPQLMEELRLDIPHSVKLIDSEFLADSYTCSMYAFDLIENPLYLSVASSGLGRTFAGESFMHYLLQEEWALEPLGAPEAGNLAIYLESGVFRHIGRVKAHDRVISKWGEGQLWEHATWEVPSLYGDDVQYYRIRSELRGIDLFERYAESEGFEFYDSNEGHV